MKLYFIVFLGFSPLGNSPLPHNKYWSTSRINIYLSTKPEKKPFKLETFYYNEFINKQNQHIKYLNYQISSLPKKEKEIDDLFN